MKATKLITTAAVATLGLTLLAPTVLAENPSNGDAKQLTGKGYIEYEENTDTNEPKDPEKPTDPVVDPPGVVNPDGGPISIDFVGTLNFKGDGTNGKAKIKTDAGTYFAAEADAKDKDGKAIKRGNWIQVTDKRSVDKDGPKGWSVSAELTQQFQTANAENTLNGATIDYTNPVVTTANNVTGIVPGVTANTNQLEYKAGGGASKEMVTAEKGSGFGTYFVQYGREEGFGGLTADNKTSDKSVKLSVPANTPLAAKKYDANITWTIKEI